MRHVIIGTAGHIDHGKTQLIKALTGINTDRLKEEQERGISIELGFAKLALASGLTAGIVDVPGHERFVKNMVAGASGIDIVILVVAADDGIMPQTREHLAIIDLLGVSRGVVALTKIDTVDEEWLEIVTQDVEEFLSKTSLAGAKIIPVSSVTNEGIEELKAFLGEMAGELEEHDEVGEFRMPIDRVFMLKGIGTVLTGTLWSGSISVQDQVAILPKGATAKVRSIEVHGEFVDTAHAGQRVALNLAGLSRDDADRGDMVLPPGYLSPSYMFDAKYTHLDSAKPLKTRTRVRLHHGTSEVLGRIILLDREELKPSDEAFIQMRLEEPIVPRFRDRYIIRSYSPIVTIGGGVVLDSHPVKHKANNRQVLDELEIRLSGSTKEIIRLILAHGLMTEKEIIERAEIKADLVKENIARLIDDGAVLVVVAEGVERFITSDHYEELKTSIKDYLGAWREKHPIALGVNKETLRSQLLWDLPAKTTEVLLARLRNDGIILIDGDLIKEVDAKLKLTPEQEDVKKKIAEVFARSGYQPPTLLMLQEKVKKEGKELLPLLKILEAEKVLVQVQQGLYFSFQAFEEAVAKVRDFIGRNGQVTVADFRDMVNTSRKFALPLLEYMDKEKITKRAGDSRVLR